MSTLVSQLVLHPAVSQSLKLWATTAGRDKTYRAVQYFAKFLAWYLIRRGYPVEGARWNNLKNSLAAGRKILRLFKPLEILQGLIRSLQSPSTSLEQFTTIGRQVGYFGYMSYDMIAWAHSIRFITLNPARAVEVNKTSIRFWTTGILFSIVDGILRTGRLANEANALRHSSSDKASLGDDAARQTRLSAIATQRASTHYQLIIDSLDIWLPVTALGLVNLNDGTTGALGFITSVMGLRTQWKAVSK